MEIYGAIQLFLYVSGGVVVTRFLREHAPSGWPRIFRGASARFFIATATMIAFWWYAGYYHREMTPQAEALKSITELVQLWEVGERAAALQLLDKLTLDQPWVRDPEPYREM